MSCEAYFGTIPNNTIPYSSGAAGIGPYWAQLFSKMNIANGDMNVYCFNVWSVCQEPPTIAIDESLYFSPKPDSANTAPPPSGKTINVLHLSDWHIDPRYDVGSEDNCSQSLYCRPYSTNTQLNTSVNNASVPASRFGAYLCDTPADLALSSFADMHQFFDVSNVSFSIFTGAIVSHDRNDQLSKAYIEYEEKLTYSTFKALLGNIPVYGTLGNHDSWPEAFNTENSLNPGASNLTNAFSWNYELQSSLWANYSWINSDEQEYAATHYAAKLILLQTAYESSRSTQISGIRQMSSTFGTRQTPTPLACLGFWQMS